MYTHFLCTYYCTVLSCTIHHPLFCTFKLFVQYLLSRCMSVSVLYTDSFVNRNQIIWQIKAMLYCIINHFSNVYMMNRNVKWRREGVKVLWRPSEFVFLFAFHLLQPLDILLLWMGRQVKQMQSSCHFKPIMCFCLSLSAGVVLTSWAN